MSAKSQKLYKSKLLIVLILFVFLFSIFKIGSSFASTESFSLTNVSILKKSDTAEVNNISYEKNKIINDITFHKVGDTVTYKIGIVNNKSENYIIKSITDDNKSEYVTYEYNSYEGTKINSKEEKSFEFTAKYSKEVLDISQRDQLVSVNFIFTLEDESKNTVEQNISIDSGTTNNVKNETETSNVSEISNSSEETNVTSTDSGTEEIIATANNPKTEDNIGLFIKTAIISAILLVITLRNNKMVSSVNKKSSKGKHYGKGFKSFGLLLALAITLPSISKAVSNSFETTIENTYRLYDKNIVTYNIDGNRSEIVVKYNELISEIPNPTKEGYTFSGWMLEDGTSFDSKMPITDDITIVADFEPIVYTISYELDDGIVTGNPSTYTIEDEFTLKNPQKTGYTFSGWTGSNGDTLQTTVTINKGTTGNKTYNANYDINSYTVSFDTKGGTTVEDIIKNYNEEIGTLPNTEKTEYVFDGWYEDENYTKVVESTTKVTGDITYYAKWRDYYNYTVSLDVQGGKIETNSIIVKEGTAIPTLPTPTKTDYKFDGWYTDSSYTTKAVEGAIITGDVTYYAKWKDKLQIVFKLDDEVTFNGQNNNITGTGAATAYTNQKYIDTGIKLFNEENYQKDFEIGFEIVEYIPGNQDSNKSQQTFVNAKLENQSVNYPGLVFRRRDKSDDLEVACRVERTGTGENDYWKYNLVKKVKIARKNNILYYSKNDEEFAELEDLSKISIRFDTPVTFGASLNNNGSPIRILTGTLKNLYIKLEQ